MSLQKQFIKFDENIRLTWQDDKIRKIREKDESIKENIRKKFKEKGYSVQEFFKQGSYATKTTIIPLDDDYDIDVAVVINSKDAPDDPTDPKKVLRDVLKDRNLKEPKIKLPCVTAQYYKSGEKNFHLDYPIYKKDELNRYYLAVGKEFSSKEIKKWDDSDPKGITDWLNDRDDFNSDEAYSQYKRIIKYIKRWRDFKISGTEKKKVYSIGLSIMIRESFIESISYDGDIKDIESIIKTLSGILNGSYFTFTSYNKDNNPQYDITVKLPKVPYRDVFEKHGKSIGTLVYNKLTKFKNKLEEVIKEEKLKKQCEILAEKVFGGDFPIPKDDTGNKKFKEAGYIRSPQGA